MVTYIYRTRSAAGEAAAVRVADAVRSAIGRQGGARVVFASAPSQLEFLAALVEMDLDWQRVEVFHMDEYLGLGQESPRSFSYFLSEHLVDQVKPSAFHVLDGLAEPGREAERYTRLLRRAPVDVVCCGVGENGHLAFNDPGVADFEDPLTVKRVSLSEESRRQQVADRMFRAIGEVPGEALTMTIPALVSASVVSCVVSGGRKRRAVREMLEGPIDAACPASILREHRDCTMYVDIDAYGRR